MTWNTIGVAGRADDADDITIRIGTPVRRWYRVQGEDVPRVLGGYAALLYAGDAADAIGDIATSASGTMLIGASRAGLGFVPAGAVFPPSPPAFLIPRDHLRAHYDRDDGPVEVLGTGDA